MVRDALRDAPDGASSDWTGGMSGLSLRFKKDMLDSVVGKDCVVRKNGKLWPRLCLAQLNTVSRDVGVRRPSSST